ncbi:MAG: prepilin peptidase [Anaerosomatales bacterium]|nr:prepilin peptidase [Anaerosomatales bacterium]MDT8433199.1 prepilin peptidase [Anaerosomatales bacterium]
MITDLTFFAVAMFVFGLLVGSFANVVIWRFPRGESLNTPGSHCPSCGAPVRWYDNVPVISWILLRARCRSCGEPIASRYPAVELLSALLWLTAALTYGVGVQAVIAGLFFWTLLILTFIDLDTMRLPNPIVAVLAVLGLIGATVSQFASVQWVPLTGAQASPLLVALLGAVLGAGLSGGIAALYAGVRGRSGFGMGDVKLLGAMGLFLGPYVLLSLFIGSLFGAVVGIITAARSGNGLGTKIPFGPFLALGGIVAALVGPDVVRMYLALVTG